MVAKQKNELLRLLQEYFIRSIGRDYDVNGVTVDNCAWNMFATILNQLGPSKHEEDWKKVSVILICPFNEQPLMPLFYSLFIL